MTLLDDTLAMATDLGRAAASQATDAAVLAGKGLSDAAHQGQTVFEDLSDTVTGSDRHTGRRIMVLAVIATIAGIVIWRRSSDRGESEHDTAAKTADTGTEPGSAATPEVAMSPNVDAAARTDATR